MATKSKATEQRSAKRIIVCCDGTWMDCDGGYTKPTILPYHPNAVLQIPSNVTRICRAFRRFGRDGKHQIIYYHNGVGSGGSFIDSITGGLLGTGISENIREAYSFITTNYMPGDEIVIIGFSRGAFTARSIAGLIRDIGLLTREGMRDFFAIFKDSANRHNDRYFDIFPTVPFKDKPKGPNSGPEYKQRLIAGGLTRVNDPDGNRIHIEAVAVWDTVGSLGIPNMTILSKLGLPHSTKEFKFYDTSLHSTIKHAFQALALEEHRKPFSPAVWERTGDATGTDLRQVWFPGSHASVGGGYADQEIANMSLAWMMDQLSSIGIAFKDSYIDTVWAESRNYYRYLESLEPPKPSLTTCFCLASLKSEKPWAKASIFEKCHPVRPFGFGKIYESEIGIWLAAGKQTRTPGLYKRMDPSNGQVTTASLTQTNERVHSSVRLRLTCDGLDNDDKHRYLALPLMKSWHPERVKINVYDPIGEDAALKWGNSADDSNVKNSEGNAEPGIGSLKKKPWFGLGGMSMQMTDGMVEEESSQQGTDGTIDPSRATDGTVEESGYEEGGDGDKYRWVWKYIGPEAKAPKERIMVEENLGPYELRLLALDGCEEIRELLFGGGCRCVDAQGGDNKGSVEGGLVGGCYEHGFSG